MLNAEQQRLLDQLESYPGISRDQFYTAFSPDPRTNPDFVRETVQAALTAGDPDVLHRGIQLLQLSGTPAKFIDLLNELIVHPGHRRHQEAIKMVQDIGDPSSVRYLRRALERGFDYLDYTCSEDAALAKWFSWALWGVGNTEALTVIRDFTASPNEEVSAEMRYRLRRIDDKGQDYWKKKVSHG